MFKNKKLIKISYKIGTIGVLKCYYGDNQMGITHLYVGCYRRNRGTVNMVAIYLLLIVCLI